MTTYKINTVFLSPGEIGWRPTVSVIREIDKEDEETVELWEDGTKWCAPEGFYLTDESLERLKEILAFALEHGFNAASEEFVSLSFELHKRAGEHLMEPFSSVPVGMEYIAGGKQWVCWKQGEDIGFRIGNMSFRVDTYYVDRDVAGQDSKSDEPHLLLVFDDPEALKRDPVAWGECEIFVRVFHDGVVTAEYNESSEWASTTRIFDMTAHFQNRQPITTSKELYG